MGFYKDGPFLLFSVQFTAMVLDPIGSQIPFHIFLDDYIITSKHEGLPFDSHYHYHPFGIATKKNQILDPKYMFQALVKQELRFGSGPSLVV